MIYSDERQAQGVTVTRESRGYPPTYTISLRDKELVISGTPQARGLLWALGEILAADPKPQDRPEALK